MFWEDFFALPSDHIGVYSKTMTKQSEPETPIIPENIKDVVGYEWNGLIYPSKLLAAKAKAQFKIDKLFPRTIYDNLSINSSKVIEKYEEILVILQELKNGQN